jgi:hypothetical protein
MTRPLSNTLEICTKSRQTIVDYQAVEHDKLVLDFALQDMIEIDEHTFENPKVQEAATHIATCPDCRTWDDDRNPQRAIHQKRVSKYCCIHMFDSVTNPEAQTRFEFGFIRDEPCWAINDNYEFASFCPWCGTKLPVKSFE